MKPMQSTGGGDPLRTGRDEQVVGVAEDQLIAEPGDLLAVQAAHGRLRRQRDEGGRLDRPVRRVKRCRSARAAPSRRARSQTEAGCGSLPHAIKERPVIASGWAMPSSARAVGATSARIPPLAQLKALGGDDQRHRVERVGGVGRAVGLEHVVAVAVVGGDDAGAAAEPAPPRQPRRGSRPPSPPPPPRRGSPRCGRPCRGWRS